MANPFEQFDAEPPPVNPFAQFDDLTPVGPSNIPEAFKERVRKGDIGAESMGKPLQRLFGVGGEDRFQFWPERLLRSALSAPAEALSGQLQVSDPETGMPTAEAIERAGDVANFALGSTVFRRIRAGMSGPVHEPIGTLPKEDDFTTAASALNRRSSDLSLRFKEETPVTQEDETGFKGFVTGHKYEIADKDGEAIGHATVVPSEDGHSLNVDWIGSDEGSANKLNIGPSRLRGFLDQLREIYPDAEELTGERITGAHRAGTEKVSIKLRPSPVEQNLRDLWDDKGIHPAEALHDAQNDSFLKQELTAENPDPKDRSGIAPAQGSPVAEGTPRTEIAKTGEAHIDGLLDHPVLRKVINNPVIDDTHTIPNSWGGSVPLENPVTYIDKDFPRSLTVDGVTFDPADAAAIHENVEQAAMEVLTGGSEKEGLTGAFINRIASGDLDVPTVEELGNTIKKINDADRSHLGMDEKTFKRLQQLNREIDRGSDEAVREKNELLKQTPDKPELDIPDADQIRQLKTEFENLEKSDWEGPKEYVDGIARTLKRYISGLIEGDGFSKAVFRKAFEEARKHGIDTKELGNEVINRFLSDLSPSDAAFMREEFARFTTKKLPAPKTEFMDRATALKVAFWEFGEKAEDAFYRAHGMDPKRVEATLAPIVDEIAARKADDVPPDLFKGTYPDGDPAKAGPGPIDKPTAAEIARAKEIVAAHQEAQPAPAGADITRPENLPSLERQPLPPRGSIVEAARAAVDQAMGLARNIQYLLDPMATGSNRAMVVTKDAISAVRRIRWDHARVDAEITRRFDHEQQGRMWSAADEESVALQLGESREHQGLATLTRDERNMVDLLHGEAQDAWLRVRDTGIVEGEGLPAYTPRMVLNVAAAGDHAPRALNELGRNVFTRTSQMLHRKHMMAEETEAAAKELVRKKLTDRGASPQEIEAAVAAVQIARNIRSLPLATARLQEAAVWKDMITKVEDIGKATGQEMVAVGFKPDNTWFTIEGHPAFTKWRPDFAENPVTGRWEARVDDAGNAIFKPSPLYLPGEFKGPMHAILDEGSSAMKAVPGAPSLYGALMAIKGKAMTAILNSPLIHNEVVWSKVAEAAGGREWLGFGLYTRGNRIVAGHPARAGELIERGLNPIGPRGSVQDITAIMEEPNLQPGRSWTAKVLGAVPGLFDAGAEVAVKQAIDKAGDFWHNTLLWDRVRDVQFGLADHLSDRLVAKGADRLTADRIAAHFANIIVGSIPKEAMSAGARATANLFLFSRSFTLGNLSTFKQAAAGLPKPVLAQIERDFGMSADAALGPEAMAEASQTATSIARRKAISTIALSAGLYYVGNALIQHGFNIAKDGSTVDEEMQGYARRYAALMKDTEKDPWELRHLLGRLSPTYDNEPQKQDRAHVGYDKDGSAIYARNPTGKFGEEMVGYPTMPLEMVKRKLSPLAGGILEVLENDKGFGRKIYDPNDRTIGGDVANAFAVAKHLVMRHLPEGQISAAVDLLHGEGDTDVNRLRVFGPAAGFTVSVGAPGGMARGEQLSAKQAFEARFNIAWPDIRKQIQRGDETGARNAMVDLGVPLRMQNGLIRVAKSPASALRGGTLREFYQYSTPEQRDRLERAR